MHGFDYSVEAISIVMNYCNLQRVIISMTVLLPAPKFELKAAIPAFFRARSSLTKNSPI